MKKQEIKKCKGCYRNWEPSKEEINHISNTGDYCDYCYEEVPNYIDNLQKLRWLELKLGERHGK